jgi:hypothetical protein
MITEDYVSFEIAKLLKDKGFDGKCRMIYREHDKQMIYHTPNPDDLLDFETNKRKLEKHSKKQHCDYALCPTHQMALKWLREVHNIFIEIGFLFNQFTEAPSYKAMIWDISEEKCVPLPSDIEFMFYETCVSEALKYTLKNLI